MLELRTCEECQTEYPLTTEFFHADKDKEGGPRWFRRRCIQCNSAATARRKRAQRAEHGIEVRDPYLLTDLPPPHPLEPLLRERGRCSGDPTWLHDGGRAAAYAVRRAVCAACPVIAECREVVEHIESESPLTLGNMAGVWAGETPAERVKRRRNERRSRAA